VEEKIGETTYFKASQKVKIPPSLKGLVANVVFSEPMESFS
jgi:hypothetical protein